jgi:hypothetical protein
VVTRREKVDWGSFGGGQSTVEKRERTRSRGIELIREANPHGCLRTVRAALRELT